MKNRSSITLMRIIYSNWIDRIMIPLLELLGVGIFLMN
nr:MAG TPA: hypothetical protein [Caudoviricetes sp.]